MLWEFWIPNIDIEMTDSTSCRLSDGKVAQIIVTGS